MRESQIIKLTNDIKGQAYGGYVVDYPPYYTNSTYTGELYLSKFDTIQQIASGTFYFTAIKSAGDTVKVTNGRFDMHYTR